METLFKVLVFAAFAFLARLWTVKEDEDAKNHERRKKGAPVPRGQEKHSHD